MLLSFRRLLLVVLGAALLSWGCERQAYKGPKINAFKGRLTQKGEPVSFPEDEKVVLRLMFQQNGQAYGVPIHSDGAFEIGWMPIGKYTPILVRTKNAPKESQPSDTGRRGPRKRGGPMKMYTLPSEFVIEEGKTEYTIDVGPDWKP